MRWRKNGKRIRNESGARVRCEDCPCDDVCVGCVDGESNPVSAPSQQQLTVASGLLSAGGCSNCVDAEGIFVLNLTSIQVGDATQCAWASESIPLSGCSASVVSAQWWLQIGYFVFLRFYDSGGSEVSSIFWSLISSPGPCEFSSSAFSRFAASGAHCSPSTLSSSVHVTTL